MAYYEHGRNPWVIKQVGNGELYSLKLITYKTNFLFLNFLKPSGFLRSIRFNIQKFYMAVALPSVFCTDIRTDSDFYFIQH